MPLWGPKLLPRRCGICHSCDPLRSGSQEWHMQPLCHSNYRDAGKCGICHTREIYQICQEIFPGGICHTGKISRVLRLSLVWHMPPQVAPTQGAPPHGSACGICHTRARPSRVIPLKGPCVAYASHRGHALSRGLVWHMPPTGAMPSTGALCGICHPQGLALFLCLWRGECSICHTWTSHFHTNRYITPALE